MYTIDETTGGSCVFAGACADAVFRLEAGRNLGTLSCRAKSFDLCAINLPQNR